MSQRPDPVRLGPNLLPTWNEVHEKIASALQTLHAMEFDLGRRELIELAYDFKVATAVLAVYGHELNDWALETTVAEETAQALGPPARPR